jgi:1,4-dihydroxy-2-naphthoate polyprenyltransferase
VAPVLVGSGAAAALDRFLLWKAVLALIVSLALQVGVNYSNDYSDGVRGTDEGRVGPMRLVGSGRAAPRTVLVAAWLCFGVAGIAGLVLSLTTAWWLILFGIAAVAAAWFYTGGPKPYGYAGFGEVFVFLFFGLLAVLGTQYVQAERVSTSGLAGAIGLGLLACALLMVNNLRDIETDPETGKRTLAVLLGDRLSRVVLVVMIGGAFLAVIVIGIRHPWCLLALLAAPLAIPPVRATLGGVRGRALIPALGAIGRLEIVWSILLTVGLILDRG